MKYPLVTCGLTAYNAADSVGRAVEAIIAQDYRPIEIVVVDDVSIDATPHVLAGLASKYPELRVFRQAENGGVALARNRIISEARGEFIAFFDDDDISAPERIRTQLVHILDCERSSGRHLNVLCHAARRVVYPNGSQQIWNPLSAEASITTTGETVALAILGARPMPKGMRGGSTATCTQMARRETYIDIGLFDGKFRRCEDCDFAVRAALCETHFVGVAAPLVMQWLTPTSDKGVALQRLYGTTLLEKHRALLEKRHSYRFARRYYAARHALMAGEYGRLLVCMLGLMIANPSAALRRVWSAAATATLNMRMGKFYRKTGLLCNECR